MSTIAFEEFLSERLRNPEFAAHYLNSILDDGSPEEIAEAVQAILVARNEASIPAVNKPIVEQVQHLMHQAGLRLHVQPA